jgi:peptide subunit release factor 1 (eRF1)
LVQRNPSDRCLSVFLDTSSERAIGQGYAIAFREHGKTMRQQLEPEDRDDRRRFEAAIAQVETYLAGLATPGAPGLAIFATGDDKGIIATPLPIRPLDRVVWANRPAVEPLASALDECERIAVLLFDKERSRLFTIFLGEIEERHLLVDEVPGKQETGDWFALSQKRYERHHEDHVLRHAKRTIHALREELQSRPFDRLLIGGTEEAVSLLLHRLPPPLRGRFVGTLTLPLYAREDEVLAAARKAAEAVERREEVEAVQALLDAETTPPPVLGLEGTLGALAAGKVHRLFVAAELNRDGRVCETCGRVTAALDRCPSCTGATRPVADLKEQAVEAALAQDARVEIVSGLASTLLMRHGGLGALTRY